MDPTTNQAPRKGWRRWRWLLLPLALLLTGGIVVTGYLWWRSPNYAAAAEACRDVDVRPLVRLLGTETAVPVEAGERDEAGAHSVSCGFRTPAGLVTVAATAYPSRAEARDTFDHTSQGTQRVDGVGERAELLVTPVSSDAPEVMTLYVLHVLDENLLLAVGLTAFSHALTADEAAVRRALLVVARNALAAFDNWPS